MLLVAVLVAHQQQAKAVFDPVHVVDGLNDFALLLFGAHRKRFAKVPDSHGRHVRLEDQLRDIGAGRIALLELFVYVFDLAGSPVLFVDLFLDRQHPSPGHQKPTVVDL